MECPICDTDVLDVLVNDDRACPECGHRWTPDEARVEPGADRDLDEVAVLGGAGRDGLAA